MGDDKATPFEWQGKELSTIGDLMDAMSAILVIPYEATRDHVAAEFMESYRAVNEHADANIGYLCGYFGHDDMVKALRLFRTAHPIFGGPAAANQMTAEKALETGKTLGESMKAGSVG